GGVIPWRAIRRLLLRSSPAGGGGGGGRGLGAERLSAPPPACGRRSGGGHPGTGASGLPPPQPSPAGGGGSWICPSRRGGPQAEPRVSRAWIRPCPPEGGGRAQARPGARSVGKEQRTGGSRW